MNVNEMTPEEKSVMLARLINWVLKFEQGTVATESHYSVWQQGNFVGVCRNGDLYDTANMALLARVIEWVCKEDAFVMSDYMEPANHFELFFDPLNFHKSMCLFADEALSSAIEAGLTQERDERP